MPFKDYCELPTLHGTFRMYDTNDELLRLVTFGDINKLNTNPLLRLHSSCLASEVFEAQDCDCTDQLRETMKAIAHEGCGIIIHLHQEGRGQGLSKKIQAVYKMQSEALDTVESFEAMGLEQDTRDYGKAIKILETLNVQKVRLISNNPRKMRALEQVGIEVETVNTHPKIRKENSAYLKSKNDKLGHCLPLDNKSNDTTPIYFYHSDQAWGEFSNFSQHAIFLKSKIWKTTEHFYQAQKFIDLNLQEHIRTATSPMLAKERAKQFEAQHQRNNWHDLKYTIMQQALAAKFTQHPELRELLLSTQLRHIAEHTSNDSYWGDAGDGSGLNRLGELLIQLRTELQITVDEELQICAV